MNPPVLVLWDIDRALVDDLATGWDLLGVAPFEEGELPRRLWRITQTKPVPR